MDRQTIIAAAQISIDDEDIAHNLKAHQRLIELAALNGVQFLVFPEMSITGYVRETADRQPFTQNDPRLNELKNLSARHNMTIVAGAPVRLGSALHIGAFIFRPDQTVSLYTKQFLFNGENDFYMPNCGNNPLLLLDKEQISLAICFDIENKPHVEKAAEAGSTIYAPGIFFTEGAMSEAHDMLSGYAKSYSLNVLMSNFSGRTYHAQAGGQSAFWNSSGDLLASLAADKTGLVIGIKSGGEWTGKTVIDDQDIYNCCPAYKNEHITLRKTTLEDAEALLSCYSDEKAIPLFNSDNCDGDDFHYTTLERMHEEIKFWEHFYKARNFVRWTIIANESGDKIGTIEMYGRSAEPDLGRYGILRIDLRSDYETVSVLTDILKIADDHFFKAFDVSSILTKAIPAAAVRIGVLTSVGYVPLKGALVKYGDYFVKTIR